MTLRKPHLLTLSLAVAAALSGCKKPEEAPAPAATTAPAPVAAAKPSFDVSELDTSINACNDFDAFVNAKWLKANPIPDDRTRWGAFDQLAENSLNTQHALVEAATKNTDAGSIEHKIGLLYASGIDEAAIEKA
ncbi:MAG: hypothetical protein QM581_06855, partial [Pseudomonas sp.]